MITVETESDNLQAFRSITDMQMWSPLNALTCILEGTNI